MKEYSNDNPNEKKYYSSDINLLNDNEIKEYKTPLKNISNEFHKGSIKVLSYNFFCRPPPINTNGNDYKNERLNDFVELMPDFDIICFQEVFTTLNDRKHKMIREGAKAGLKYYLSAQAPSFFSGYLSDSGLLILSRYEIVENDRYDYYLNISGDAASKKGILYAKIKINDKYLFLFNTHLQSSYFDESQKNIDNTIKVRTAQVEELINFVYNKLLSIPKEQIEKGLVLIVGDFNIDAHDNKVLKDKFTIPKYNTTEYEILKKKLSKLGTAIDLMEKKYNDHLYTFGNNDKPEYDHVLTGKGDLNMKQVLDYMWEIIPNYNLDIYKNNNSLFIDSNNENEDEENNEEEKGKIKVLYDSFKVEEFLIKDRPYQQLSDHFGISVELFADSENLI
jgi:endonuclease/exonuclease/phosphatase family metal-dependent hydrolase